MDQNQLNQQYGQTAPQPAPMPTPQQPAASTTPQGRSAMGIVGLVLGILALCISFVPIVNNFSALLAVVGLIFAIIGVVQTSKGKRSGKGMSIAALILNVLAFIIVMATQAIFSAAFDEALSTNSPSQTVAASTSASTDASTASQDNEAEESFENLPLGTAVELNNGLSISVDSVQAGLKNYDGSDITGITVTYTNNGTSTQSFNVYDWKGEDAQGAQRSTTYYSKATDELNSGSLAAGGTVTGSVYFDGTPTKAVYEQLISFDDSIISWTLA